MAADHTIRPIAILRTPFAEKFGVPRQSGLIMEAEGRVEFLPEFAAPEFVRGLEAFSHLWLITGFHQGKWSGSAVVRPPRLGGNEKVGVFASRSPNRPNGLGLSLVKLVAIEPGAIRVAGVDSVDGTPVYDVKPYLPWTESRPDATSDWAKETPDKRPDGKILLPEVMAEKLGPQTAQLVRAVLQLDLEPAYHDDQQRIYGLTVAGWNIRWRSAGENVLEVIEVERV